jgi:hypothetical protein
MNPPIVVSMNSDYYGTYWMECIGIIDYLALIKSMSAGDFIRWSERYHPAMYFSGFMQETLHEHKDSCGKSLHAGRELLFVPSASANEQWDFNASAYSRAVGGRKRVFPAAESRARILKWQSSISGNALTPQWLVQCQSVDELRAIDKERSGQCEHCWS